MAISPRTETKMPITAIIPKIPVGYAATGSDPVKNSLSHDEPKQGGYKNGINCKQAGREHFKWIIC